MEYAYAVLILNETGEELNETNITGVLEAAGADVEQSRVKALVAALEDVTIEEAIPAPDAVETLPEADGADDPGDPDDPGDSADPDGSDEYDADGESEDLADDGEADAPEQADGTAADTDADAAQSGTAGGG